MRYRIIYHGHCAGSKVYDGRSGEQSVEFVVLKQHQQKYQPMIVEINLYCFGGGIWMNK